MKIKFKLSRTLAIQVFAAALAVSLMVGSSFAYVDYRQHLTNELKNNSRDFNVSLVETEFKEVTDWAKGEKKDKNVYVKNLGDDLDTYLPAYIRLTLKEYMEIISKEYEFTKERYMTNTEAPYIGEFLVYDTETAAQTAYPNHEVKELTDALTGRHGWYVQTQWHDDNGQYGKFLVTKINDKAKVIFPSDGNYSRREEDKHNDAPYADHNEYNWSAYDWENYPDGHSEIRAYIELGLNSGDIIKLSDWNGVTTNKWIYDDTIANPFIYWGQPLDPGTETSLLLDYVDLKVQPEGEFYYGIRFDMEAVSYEDLLNKWNANDGKEAPTKILEAFGVLSATPSEPTTPEKKASAYLKRSDVQEKLENLVTEYAHHFAWHGAQDTRYIISNYDEYLNLSEYEPFEKVGIWNNYYDNGKVDIYEKVFHSIIQELNETLYDSFKDYMSDSEFQLLIHALPYLGADTYDQSDEGWRKKDEQILFDLSKNIFKELFTDDIIEKVIAYAELNPDELVKDYPLTILNYPERIHNGHDCLNNNFMSDSSQP